jgi:hypothetical protein
MALNFFLFLDHQHRGPNKLDANGGDLAHGLACLRYGSFVVSKEQTVLMVALVCVIHDVR